MLVLALAACGRSTAPPPPPSDPAVPPAAQAPAVDSRTAPAWSDAACRHSELAREIRNRAPNRAGARIHRTDVDGDGQPDLFEYAAEAGASEGHVELKVRLSTGHRLTIAYDQSLTQRMTRIPVPPDTSEPHRRILEDALWGTSCPTPDPSLEALLEPEVRVWHDGPPVLPPTYVVPRAHDWLVYSGETDGGDGVPRALASQDGTVVRATAHGVLAERGGAHAWVYVAPAAPRRGEPSAFSARLVDPEVVEITAGSPTDPDRPPKVFLRRL